ncbi:MULTISPECIES: DUF2187 family protein [Amylolactobacillus]|nr:MULTISPECIES: DUF2187 family protein [Amylolactobacillus]APT18733.1 DUF2187 domain-containing protein [Amylolactobacillus amylophilus DSM 20533 = JCM 1125]GED80646.1 hypothetical protein LAM01_11190 [Amylolactobacillus amylophilus]
MKKEELEVGQTVSATVKEDIKKPFTGKVEKIYENSVLLEIVSNEAEDNTAVSELNNKIVVNLSSIKKAK